MLTNHLLTSHGFFRVAVVVPETRVADVAFNVREIAKSIEQAATQGIRLALFPELCITGYSCADLFYQSALQESALAALTIIIDMSARYGMVIVVGLPVEVMGRLYNCAVVIANGSVLGVVPKAFLPTTNEFYEERWFTSGMTRATDKVRIGDVVVPFGTDILFQCVDFGNCVLGVEVCEDLWAVHPPSGEMALSGATIILNPSASNELLGKAGYRRDLVRQQSARCLTAYLYTSAGPGESSTDVVYSGHALIAENGVLLAETTRFQFGNQMEITDVDLEYLIHERLRSSSFSAAVSSNSYRTVHFSLMQTYKAHHNDIPILLRQISRTPFVPNDPKHRDIHCKEIFAIQSTGLAKRLKHVDADHVTLGLSGGLDSTLALLVTVKAFDILDLCRSGIVTVTMPGFGTSTRTKTNAVRLAQLLGTSLREIDICESVSKHFHDIGHVQDQYDVVYENAQARERTQILMDIANQVGGLVIGTGDLSELALGWCTYNGDHMSMYSVNAGVPKTLVRYLVDWCAESEYADEISIVLRDICRTPITPELLPLGQDGILEQKTEFAVGPYELHDFFLFYMVRCAFSPRKIYFLAHHAFHEDYSNQDILHWLSVFYRRFFSQQFKRSAVPDGPKVGSVALSPRGDWRMPSDASSELWLRELSDLK